MTERPILFSAPMVRAILTGTKTQTRRALKPQPTHFNPVGVPRLARPEGPNAVIGCPYGQPGDRLWVREAHSIGPGPGVHLEPGESAGALRWPHVTYAADGAIERRDERWTGVFGKSRPSIHMPRWASRILLEIVSVRVERLQAISEADALAEGCHPDDTIENGLIDPGTGRVSITYTDRAGSALESFVNLWERIHEVRPGDHGDVGWDDDPWVWVVEFRRVQSTA